jgi:ABC-type sugar transport system ATPase subunit
VKGSGRVTETPSIGQVVLSARGLNKQYPGIQALREVDIDLYAGEVHGLIGENGAGKSTLVNVLSGVTAPDTGTVAVGGRKLEGVGPGAGHRAGIAVVHQEPNVVPALSPVANVFLGQAVSRAGFLSETEMRHRFLRWTRELGIELPEKGASGKLSIAAQQSIEIVRALERGAQIVLMDEPTASLGQEEREGLFRMLDTMRTNGAALVFISHKLDDVLRVAARVTVMRDGERVMTTSAHSVTSDTLVQAMLGRQLENVLETRSTKTRRPNRRGLEEVLRIESLNVPGILTDNHLSISAGEIIGIAGLVGAGRSTVLRSIGGAEPSADGLMFVAGKQVPWPRTPRRAHRLGLALVPEDRRTEGLVMSLTSAENLVLPTLKSRSRWGFNQRRKLFADARSQADTVDFSHARLRARAGNLSGGNQQKVVLGKFLPFQPSVLLIDEPTRGIDVGAKAEILRMLQDLASGGMAIIAVSEELEELIALADKIVVLNKGSMTDLVSRGEIQAERILTAMLPARRQEAVMAL